MEQRIIKLSICTLEFSIEKKTKIGENHKFQGDKNIAPEHFKTNVIRHFHEKILSILYRKPWLKLFGEKLFGLCVGLRSEPPNFDKKNFYAPCSTFFIIKVLIIK